MTPAEYVRQYHNFVVSDPRLGINVQCDIRAYVSKYSYDRQKFADGILASIDYRYFSKKGTANNLPKVFYIENEPKIDPSEYFTVEGVRRSFQARGSPDEMRDALRLAVLTKKCKVGEIHEFVKTWFGSDCNAYVANWQGVSPGISVGAYATGYGAGPIGGAGPATEACRGLLPLPPRKSPAEIKMGDVIVTHGKLNSRGEPWNHVALVQNFDAKESRLTVAEWGGEGGELTHNRAAKVVKIIEGHTIDSLPGKKFVAFKEDEKSINVRIFLDASGWNEIETRGWYINNQLGL